MNELSQHWVLVAKALLIYWAFSAFVTSMPKPTPSNYWATWIYDFLHLFAGSVKTFADSRISTLTQQDAAGNKTFMKVEEPVAAKPDKKEP